MGKSPSRARDRRGIVLKLAISFGVLIALVSVVDWLALRQISRADADLDAVVDARWERVELVREVQSSSSVNGRLILESFVSDSKQKVKSLLAQRDENTRHISELIESLQSKADTPEERDLLADIQTKRDAYRSSCRRALDLLTQEQKPVEARALLDHEVSPLLSVYHRAVEDYVHYQGRRLDAAQAANLQANSKAQNEALLLISLATVFALGIAIVITTYTAKQLARRVRAEDELRKAHQDLEAQVVTRTAALLEANQRLQTEAAQRREVESTLRESEQRYRQIVDCASDTIYRTNPQGFFTFVNPSAAALVKRSVEECLGVHFLELIRDDFRATASDFYRQQVADRTPITYFEFPAVAKDQSEVWIGQNVQLVIEDGKVIELQGIARDITARKAIKRRLLESEQRYRLLFEANPLPVWVYDLETLRFIAINGAASRHYGFSREEYLAMTIKDIRPTGDISELENYVARIDDGPNYSGAWRHVKKDGSIIDVEIASDAITFAGRPARLVIAFDVTARKQAETDLHLQKARFQQLFENTPMGILRVDSGDVVLDANQEFATMFQFSVADIRGCPINETVIPPNYREEAAELSAITFAGNISKKETVRQRKDGSLVPVQVYGVPIVTEQERVGAFAIYLDLSERKRLERERQVVFDIIQGAILTSDLNELFKLIHESISKILYAENCFIALHDSETDLMHYEFWVDKHDSAPSPQRVGVGFSSYVLQSGKSILLTEELTAQMVSAGLVKKSGTFSPSWLGVPIRTASRIIGVLAVQHYEAKDAYTEADLHFLESVGSQIAMAIERKRGEQALVAANKRALNDYESLVERIAALGRTLGTARELKSIFRALRDFAVASAPCEGLVISLYEREKGLRRIVYAWTDGEELESSNGTEVPVRNGMVGRAIKSGAVVIDNNYRASLADNPTAVAIGSHVDRTCDRSALVAPMTVMGRTVGCIEVQCLRAGAFVNGHATAMRMAANLGANAIENVVLIEREQEKEEQLRQAQKMESIGTLAGGIAHDFNNLMTAVTGYSDLALRGSLDESLRGKIEQIKKAGERAATLTRQLLAFSRKQMLQPKVLDLNSVVNGLIKMLPRLIGEHIDVNLKLSSSLGRIKADPGQIEQVLMNLAVNSRDAMPQGGCLTIETRNVHLSEPIKKVGSTIEPGHYVLLSVSDCGCGMDAETQEQIFEPFFTTKGVGKGTGLGLSTVYGIVKQSGGNVLVNSEPGKGTKFKIYLPRVDEVEQSEIGEQAPAVSRGKETILLVEDEEQVRNLSKEILEAYGYSVLVAPDGHTGLLLGKEFPGHIHLVLTDVIMPQMGGKELIEKLKPLRPDSKVLFMSGFTDDAIIHHGVSDDGVFFLQKPFSTECLATKVREVLDQ